MVERRDVEFPVEGGDRLRGWLFVSGLVYRSLIPERRFPPPWTKKGAFQGGTRRANVSETASAAGSSSAVWCIAV
jgi:hypothetical protein